MTPEQMAERLAAWVCRCDLSWTVEASDRTRQLLGLDGTPEPGQTGGEEASRK